MPTPALKAAHNKFSAIISNFRLLWEKDRNIVIQHAVISGVALIILLVIFLPLFLKTGGLRAKERESQAKLKQIQDAIKKMPEWEKQQAIMENVINKTQIGFYQIRDLDYLLSNLSETAVKNQVHILGSRSIEGKLELPSPFNSQYLTATYELTIEGNYHSFGKFFNEIERQDKWLVIRGVNIEQGRGGGPLRLHCVFQLTAFVQAPQR